MRTNPTLPGPGPGIYRNSELPTADYYSLPYFSYSGAKHLAQAPAVWRYWQDNHQEPTSAMVLGDALHKFLLQPETFSEYFAVFDGPRRQGKPWDDFRELHAGKSIIKTCEFEIVKRMWRAIRDKRRAAELLDLVPADCREMALIWDDMHAGRCKAKVDFLIPEMGIAGDVKTSNDAGPEFGRKILNLKYHWQAAHYLEGLRANGFKVTAFLHIVVCSEAPHLVAVYELSERAIDLGHSELFELKQLFKQCSDSGEWPGLSEDIELIDVPEFAYKQED